MVVANVDDGDDDNVVDAHAGTGDASVDDDCAPAAVADDSSVNSVDVDVVIGASVVVVVATEANVDDDDERDNENEDDAAATAAVAAVASLIITSSACT